VISANELHAIRIAQFKTCQKGNCFHTEESPVDIIAQKKIVSMGCITTYTKNLDEVIELTVDVPNHGDGCADMNHVGLLHKDFLCLFAHFTDECLVQQLFAQKLRDTVI